MRKLSFVKLNKTNYQDCLNIKHQLFPESKSDEDYENYFRKNFHCKYYIVYQDSKPCAIAGWYDFDGNKTDAFMGWFGVMPDFRNQGIGSKTFDFILDKVIKKKYNYFRVYTDKVVNEESVCLYLKKEMIMENYSYSDNLGKTGNFVVFTKVLKSNGKDLWNNRPLNEDSNYKL